MPFLTRHNLIRRTLMLFSLVIAATLFHTQTAHAEYGDVIMNNKSDAAGIRPVVFPHWFHRIRFACKVCHSDLGIKFKAGSNKIDMVKIIEGKYCGACHNGKLAWSSSNCTLCHSGKRGTPTMVHESSQQELSTPASDMNVRK